MEYQTLLETLQRERAHALACRDRHDESQTLGHYYDGQVAVINRLIALVKAANRREVAPCNQSES
jgi:hypothetical protein